MKKRMIKIYVSEEFYKKFKYEMLPYYKSFNKYFNKLIVQDFKFRKCFEKLCNKICSENS